MFIPPELVYKICEYVSIADMVYIKQVSRDFYDGCRYSKENKKNKLREIVEDKSSVREGSFDIKREDEDTYAILIGNKRLARIEHKHCLKIYDTDIFESDDWINILGTLLRHVEFCTEDVVHLYKSNVYVFLYRGRLKLL